MKTIDIAKACGVSHDSATKVIDFIVKELERELAENGICRIKKLGTFKTVSRKEHKGCNPRTGESIVVPAHVSIKFNPADAIKKHLNDKQ